LNVPVTEPRVGVEVNDAPLGSPEEARVMVWEESSVAKTAKLRGAISFTFWAGGTDRVGAVLDDEDDVVVIINWGANPPPLFSLEAK
jgi:hypothetical protein